MKSLKKMCVGGGEHLRHRIKGGINWQNDLEREDEQVSERQLHHLFAL